MEVEVIKYIKLLLSTIQPRCQKGEGRRGKEILEWVYIIGMKERTENKEAKYFRG